MATLLTLPTALAVKVTVSTPSETAVKLVKVVLATKSAIVALAGALIVLPSKVKVSAALPLAPVNLTV